MRSRSVVTTSSCASSTRDELGPLVRAPRRPARGRGGPGGSCGSSVDDLAERLRRAVRVAHLLVERADAELGRRDLGGVLERLDLAGEDVDELLFSPRAA